MIKSLLRFFFILSMLVIGGAAALSILSLVAVVIFAVFPIALAFVTAVILAIAVMAYIERWKS